MNGLNCKGRVVYYGTSQECNYGYLTLTAVLSLEIDLVCPIRPTA
jgi:hypothetical protein